MSNKKLIYIVFSILLVIIVFFQVKKLPLYLGDTGIHIVEYDKEVIEESEAFGQWISTHENFSAGDEDLKIKLSAEENIKKSDLTPVVNGKIAGIYISATSFDDTCCDYEFVIPKNTRWESFYRVVYHIEKGERILKDKFSKDVVHKNTYTVKTPKKIEYTLRPIENI